MYAIPSEYGLKAIVSSQPNAVKMRPMAEVSYVLHQGTVVQPDENLTFAESVLKEIRQVEAELTGSTKLIYYLPYIEEMTPEQSAQLVVSLHRETAPGTCLAFPAVAGDPAHDHLPLHPLWDLLRCIPQLHGTGLLPVFNAGGIHQGEGLWPGVCFDLAEVLQARCRRHSFVGSIGLANVLPAAGGFSDANLWVMGQAIWHEISPVLLLETWLRAYKPEPMFAEAMRLLKEVRGLIVSIGRLRWQSAEGLSQDESRCFAEQALVLLRRIEMNTVELGLKRTGRSAKAIVSDYLIFFVRDAKRVLKQFLHSVNIDDDSQESIWTTAGKGGGILDSPNPGQANTKIHQIYAENRV